MSKHSGPEDNPTTTRQDVPPSGTTAGADVTSRMSGVPTTDARGDDRPRTDEHRVRDENDLRDEHRMGDDNALREDHVETMRPTDRVHGVKPAKTSAAAVFGLVFGLAALFCALTAILAPAAVVFGLIGIVLSLIGRKMARRIGVTGRGVATGGLVTAILGLLLGAAVIAGAAVIVNDEQRLDDFQNQIDELRNDLPSVEQIQSEIPG